MNELEKYEAAEQKLADEWESSGAELPFDAWLVLLVERLRAENERLDKIINRVAAPALEAVMDGSPELFPEMMDRCPSCGVLSNTAHQSSCLMQR